MKTAMAEQLREIDAIAVSETPPTFTNTIEALENSGQSVDRVNSVFSNLNSADTNEKLQIVARELAPLQAAHRDAIVLNGPLFRRIQAVWGSRTELPTVEQKRYSKLTSFVRGGALLDEPGTPRAIIRAGLPQREVRGQPAEGNERLPAGGGAKRIGGAPESVVLTQLMPA
jgi:Zn-dependent oligopeptidase